MEMRCYCFITREEGGGQSVALIVEHNYPRRRYISLSGGWSLLPLIMILNLNRGILMTSFSL